MIEHFAGPPNWDWYILFYFFFGGVSGGTYVLGTLLRLSGGTAGSSIARLAFLVSWPLLVVCPILLTLDLGSPDRFWHMLLDAGQGGLVFKSWSPMSLGAWALAVFGIFNTISFIDAVVWKDGRGVLTGAPGRLFTIVGSVAALFISGYTGVLLSVSNQPIWSDSWAIGGLFLASALSSATAAIVLVGGLGREAGPVREILGRADAYFILIEVVLVIVFLATLGSFSGRIISGAYGVLFWLGAVLLGMAVPLVLYTRPRLAWVGSPVIASVAVLVGVLALRAVIIFSAQA